MRLSTELCQKQASVASQVTELGELAKRGPLFFQEIVYRGSRRHTAIWPATPQPDAAVQHGSTSQDWSLELAGHESGRKEPSLKWARFSVLVAGGGGLACPGRAGDLPASGLPARRSEVVMESDPV